MWSNQRQEPTSANLRRTAKLDVVAGQEGSVQATITL